MTDLITKDAVEVVGMLAAQDVSPLEVIDALEARTSAVNPAVNAVVTTCFDRARDHAAALMARPLEERGPLAGLPVLIKDLSNVEGVRSTQGSPIFSDVIPGRSDDVVTTLEEAGGIVTGKSNTPEFGAGANTFNDVFGATLNPWNTALSAAGSSGGAAVALATGMAWLAHGSDLGGSLRNPASFNGIVGLRPSPFRVPKGPHGNPYSSLGVEGPMARRVADLALMLDAMSTPHRNNPLGPELPATSFLHSAQAKTPPSRVAFSPDLGITPVDPEVERVCRKAMERLSASGVEVIEAHPDFSAAHNAFQTLRAHEFAAGLHQLYENHRDQLKPEVVWNIERGLNLSSAEIAHAERQRAEIFAHAEGFMQGVDLLITPATIVPPYPVEDRYVSACNGVEFDTYIDWLAIAYAITLTGLPALSLPAGFTADGLPVGIQLVGQPRGEARLLSHANFMQDELIAMPTPIMPS
ncbi:MAG: amidase [Alphaproteobacteria bacterium]|nr:amidase [Alphaproteobacteria bacterium]